MGSRMMNRQARASTVVMRLWEPHDPGRSCLPTPSRTTSPTTQPHKTPDPCVLSRRIGNAPVEFLRIFGELELQPIEVAFEATYGWSWFADVLADARIPAHMAPPPATKAISAARGKERRRGCQDPGASVADQPAGRGLDRPTCGPRGPPA